MKTVKTLVVLLIIAVVGVGVYLYSGAYNIGADVPHTKSVYWLMSTLRERSVEVHSEGIQVPRDLNDPKLILKGAGQYAAMCTGCHLAPGMKDSEIRPGLYPEPPNLSKVQVDPREAFWVIKHGIKMSAMPAWGKTHDDAAIWSMVAFLQKLPTLTAEQYKAMVAEAPSDEEMESMHGMHEHGGMEMSQPPAPATATTPASAASAH